MHVPIEMHAPNNANGANQRVGRTHVYVPTDLHGATRVHIHVISYGNNKAYEQRAM